MDNIKIGYEPGEQICIVSNYKEGDSPLTSQGLGRNTGRNPLSLEQSTNLKHQKSEQYPLKKP